MTVLQRWRPKAEIRVEIQPHSDNTESRVVGKICGIPAVQLAEMRARAKEDGLLPGEWVEIKDENYSRDDLARPGLDYVRELVSQGERGRIYFPDPDRLADGAYLVLLAYELRQPGVQLIFLEGDCPDTPEGDFLLLMKAGFSKYERAKITQRTRRGNYLHR